MQLVSARALVHDLEPEEMAQICFDLYTKCKGQLAALDAEERDRFTAAWQEHYALTGIYPELPKLGGATARIFR